MSKIPARTELSLWLKQFFLINLVIYFIIGLAYLFHMPLVNDSYSRIFILFGYFGQLGILYFLLFIPIGLLMLFYPRFYLVVLTTVVLVFIQLIIIIDVFVFSTFSFHLNIILLKAIFSIHMVEFLGLDGWQTLMAYSLALIVIAIEVCLAMFLWKKRRDKTLKIKIWMVLVFLLVCQLFSQVLYAYAYAMGKEQTLQNSRIFPVYSGVQANHFMMNHHIVSQQEIIEHSHKNVDIAATKYLHYPLHKIHSQHIKHPPNILIIGIDAWREDTMRPNIVPHIYAYSKHASRFYNHYSGGNCTLAGLYTLYYGIPSLYWNATSVPPVFFNILHQYHYHYGVYFSAGMTYPPFYKNVFSSVKGIPLTIPGSEPYITDNNITNDGLKFLNASKKSKKPFFMFLFYNSAHSPSVPPNYKKPFLPIQNMGYEDANNHTNPVPMFNYYKDGLHYDDGLINKILLKVKALHLAKNTIVIITTDHGQEYNDNHKNYWGHSSNFTQYQTHIPLIIYWPGHKSEQIHYKTSHYDVMPTLLQDVFKVKNPTSDYSIGHNLFAHKPWKILPMGSYSYQGLIAPPYIYRFYPMGVTAVYNMHAKLQLNFPVQAGALRQYLIWASMYSR